MNRGNFFMPRYTGMTNIPLPNPMLGTFNSISRNGGLFSKITSGIRSFNWGGLLNNANKTLNVVNQALPLVRQAGPIVNNMRSMLKIAKVFGSETTTRSNNQIIENKVNSKIIGNNNLDNKKEVVEDNYPNFFV